MGYRHIDDETLLRRIEELTQRRQELNAQLDVLTGMRRGRRVTARLPRLALGALAVALLSVVLTFAVLPRIGTPRVTSTRSDARTLLAGAEMYRMTEAPAAARVVSTSTTRVPDTWNDRVPRAACPTIDDLLQTGCINAHTRFRDAWEHDFRIACEPTGDIRVVSAGPDGAFHTADDID